MIMRKNFLSRMTRRKGSTSAEPEEETYEIPPPSAIEPGVPYTAGDTEDSGYDSHQELELLAADEPPRMDSANGADAGDSGPAPALESLTAPVSDETPDAPEPSLEAAPFEEYGLELDSLTETESEASPGGAETSEQDDGALSVAAESVAEASAPEPGISQAIDPEAADDPVQEVEEHQLESVVETSPPETETPQESDPEAMDEIVQGAEEPPEAPVKDVSPHEPLPQSDASPYEEDGLDLETLTETESEASPEESPDKEELPLENEEAASEVAESAVEATTPEPDIPEERAPEVVPVAAEAPLVQPEEPSDNGFLPLVRDGRGNWRPGKGFSRKELQDAGLSPAEAARLQIRVDKRRRNAHPRNVATLEEAKSGV